MSRDRKVVEKVIASLKNIGQFEIAPLREGRDGACFRAVDPNRRISVAIRTLWPIDYEDAEDYARKLTAQARAAQSLDHGNIAKVIGSGELDGAFFLVSSWVEGRSLRQNLRSGENLNIWDLIDFARQSCTGLESAHARGIVHHALHPDNVVLEFDGSTKVLDLGLFRPNAPGVDAFHANACYLAPEQLAGHGADRMTNFYSVAVMLYEIATGKLPYTGDDWQALQFASEGEIQEPIKLVPQLAPGINAAIVKALQRDRGARYQSGPELVRALEDYKNFGKPVVVATPKPKVVSIDGAAVAPIRNPYATAPELAPAVDPRLDTESEKRSNVGPEKPALVGTLEGSGVWKRPVEGPPPASVSEEGLELPPLPPSKREQIKELATRLGLELWAATLKQVKRMDPWVVALSLLIVILGSFVLRTLITSLYPPQPENYESIRPLQPPVKPQPTPAPSTQAAEEATPATTSAATVTPPAAVEEQTSTPARATSKSSRVKTVAPGPAVFSSAKPLPPSGNVVSSFGSLELTSTPAGARVTMDGKTNQLYTTPAVIPTIAPGVHTFTVAKDGYSPATRPVQITAGVQSHLNVQLDLPSGFLTVLSTPSTAYILVDGVNTGHVTPSQVPVAPGAHTVTLRKFGYLETSDSFTVKSGEQQSRNVTLLEAGSTPEIKVVQSGGVHKVFGSKLQGVRVAVRTNPAGATVYISGQQVPKTTPVEFGLNPGSYAIEIQLAGHPAVKKTITVENGKPLVVEENLQ